MATLETQQVDAIIDNSRRKMLALGGTALAGLALASYTTKAQAAIDDNDILNFALNLEYLEANFYNLAVYGVTIDQLTSAQGGPVNIVGGVSGATAGSVLVKSNPAVNFTIPTVASYAKETALEEAKHVAFLSKTLGSLAVAQPQLDLQTSFQTLASAAGVATNPSPFDPFSSDINFLLGAYIFEDVGVSAYHGAAPSIQDKVKVLPAAVGIHAVEAYHAGLIRTTLAGLDAVNPGAGILAATQSISALRTTLANAVTGSTAAVDIGITVQNFTLNGTSYAGATITDDDVTTGACAGRSPSQVLAIVTAGNGGAGVAASGNKGLFFPAGLNGNIS